MTPTALQTLLQTYRDAAITPREQGTYFEQLLVITYLRHEATYRDLYSDVWLYPDWAKSDPIAGQYGFKPNDTGIDLIAKTFTGEYHAIQAKFYAPDKRIGKQDIDSFFTESGKKPFSHRLIITTTHHWTDNAAQSLNNQHIPVSKIDLHDLENSQIDWAHYQPEQTPVFKPKKTLRSYQQQAIVAVQAGLQHAERGKLIMACGTGKTAENC